MAPRQPRPQRRPRAEPLGAPHRGARTRTHCIRHRRLLGHRPAHRHHARVHRHARRGRWHEGRHRQGLHRRRPTEEERRRRHRGSCARPRRRVEQRSVRGAFGGGEALPQQRQGAVHDQHPAAGGRPQVAPRRRAGDANRAGPVRAWLHHLHAHRQRGAQRRSAGRRACRGAARLRRKVPVAGAAPVQHQGEERAGGARSDPTQHTAAYPRVVGRRAERSRAVPLPAHLATHARLPDGRCRRHHGVGARGGHGHRECCVLGLRVRRQRHHHHLRRLPPGLRGEHRRHRCQRRGEGSPAAAAHRRPIGAGERAHPQRPRHRAAGATRKPRSSRSWRSWASAGRPRGRPSSRPSRTAATCGRRARRSSPPGPPSPSSA